MQQKPCSRIFAGFPGMCPKHVLTTVALPALQCHQHLKQGGCPQSLTTCFAGMSCACLLEACPNRCQNSSPAWLLQAEQLQRQRKADLTKYQEQWRAAVSKLRAHVDQHGLRNMDRKGAYSNKRNVH